VLDKPLDLNSYLKLMTSTFFESEDPLTRRDFVMYVYVLFANDSHPDDFK